MITWLASYPRSGNTFFRILLKNLFGFESHTVYSMANARPEIEADIPRMIRIIGQPPSECSIEFLHRDSDNHFVKTHDLPGEDTNPAIVLIRDGRDAVVSYAH